ncbi:2-dehydropantoate 2-reductase [Candidatus Woesearchaeota archaeon]|nr:2-dehydropantoate 2-reductase [Candidatus Woesearchaeota archaeon]
MKIIILGAGAIGSLYGAKLSKLNDVVLVGNRQHADKINKSGLKIKGIENKIHKIKAITKIQNIENNTLILLTTKVYDSEKSIKSIKNLIKKDTIILCLQNGLYSENPVKQIVGRKCLVLRGITNFGAIFLKPGIVRYTNYGYTAVERSQKSKELAENFEKCGLNAHVSKDIRIDIWQKLILNCVLNPITAILRIENRGIADERLNPLKKLIIGECLKVAKKDGIAFDIDFVKKINNGIKNSRNLSSMLQDLMKGKKTEIDYLNGVVVDLGKRFGIECPVNSGIVEIVKGMKN